MKSKRENKMKNVKKISKKQQYKMKMWFYKNMVKQKEKNKEKMMRQLKKKYKLIKNISLQIMIQCKKKWLVFNVLINFGEALELRKIFQLKKY